MQQEQAGEEAKFARAAPPLADASVSSDRPMEDQARSCARVRLFADIRHSASDARAGQLAPSRRRRPARLHEAGRMHQGERRTHPSICNLHTIYSTLDAEGGLWE